MTTKSAAANFVTNANQNLSKLFKEGNFKGLAACYTKDAMLMPPGHKTCNGHRAIEKWWIGAAEGGVGSLTLRTVDLDIKGTSLIEAGGAILRDTKGKTRDSAKYIVVWKKSGKGWKMHRDIFNSNKG